MSAPAPTVLKLGGSLRADPARLRALLGAAAAGAYGPCVVVPGGGGYADAVRAAQVRDGFGDAEAHRRALDAMGRTARDLRALEPRLALSVTPWADILEDGAPSPAAPPPPAAGEGGPGVSRGRERGATVQDRAGALEPAPSLPSPPPLRGVPSPAEGGGRAA